MRVFKSLKEYYLFLNYLNLLLIDILLEKILNVGWLYIPWQPLEGEKPKMPLLRTFNPWELRYLARWVQIMYMNIEQDDVWVSGSWQASVVGHVSGLTPAGIPSASHTPSLSAVLHWKLKDSEVTIADITPFVYCNTHLALLMVLSLY